jgi:sec-independent protein translocase protein TatA
MALQGDALMFSSPALLVFDSPVQLLVVLAVFALLFGGKKLGDIGKGLGDGIRNFKDAMKGDEEKAEAKKTEDTTKQA